MTDTESDEIQEAFDTTDSFTRLNDGFACTSTSFEGVVSTSSHPDGGSRYTVDVTVPTLAAGTADEVPAVVQTDWLETLERRLAEAPKATRASVTLEHFEVTETDDTVHVRYEFEQNDPRTAARIAKTFVEYVEGTYVEGLIPGYEYEGIPAELLAAASGSDGRGTPL